jgi:hypothetical protein
MGICSTVEFLYRNTGSNVESFPGIGFAFEVRDVPDVLQVVNP